jgi:flagellar basal-body rod protein FlgB
MALDINKVLDGHARVLGLANQRLQLLADNVANADTPNYKAKDIDFLSAMRAAGQQGVRMQATNPQHIATTAGSNQAETLYRVPDQPSLDGNTVDTQKESASIAETSVRYQATLTFLNQRISGLRMAITGGR